MMGGWDHRKSVGFAETGRNDDSSWPVIIAGGLTARTSSTHEESCHGTMRSNVTVPGPILTH
jgi:hypothetical protein